jgi:membrane-bound serine protease (ClpP class)
VAITVGAVLALFVAFAVSKVLKARRAPARTGGEELAGAVGTVREALDPEGVVFVHGERWRGRSVGGATVPAGAAVRVERLADGLVLEVVPADEPAAVR